jgi:hypothetical protein
MFRTSLADSFRKVSELQNLIPESRGGRADTRGVTEGDF